MEVSVVVEQTVYWLQMTISLIAIGLAFLSGYKIGKGKKKKVKRNKPEDI